MVPIQKPQRSFIHIEGLIFVHKTLEDSEFYRKPQVFFWQLWGNYVILEKGRRGPWNQRYSLVKCGTLSIHCREQRCASDVSILSLPSTDTMSTVDERGLKVLLVVCKYTEVLFLCLRPMKTSVHIDNPVVLFSHRRPRKFSTNTEAPEDFYSRCRPYHIEVLIFI